MGIVATFGEVLLRLSTRPPLLFEQTDVFEIHFGGSEVNVAISLSRLGTPARMVSALPANDISKYALKTLTSNGVDVSFVAQKKGRMGVYYLEQGAAIRGGKVIYDREYSSFSMLNPGEIDWSAAFDGVRWFHLSGISPAVSESAAAVCLEAVRKAKSLGITVSLDLNYRKNLWNFGKRPDEIMPELVRHADLVLGDPRTANLMLGTKVSLKDFYYTGEELLPVYDTFQTHFPNVHYFAMTMREVKSTSQHSIGGVLYSQGKIVEATTIEVSPIVERIGSGDAFMAGLIDGLIQKKVEEEIINFATAACAMKLTIPGDFSPFEREHIHSIMNGGHSGLIKR